MIASAASLSAAVANVGCTTTNALGAQERTLDRSHRVVGRYGAERFDFNGRNMAIRLRDGRISPSDTWTMVNIAEDSPRGEFVSKEGDAWVSELLFDVEGSGIEDEREAVPRYDILLRHRATAASLSVRTHPLSTWADQVTLRGYADSRIDADSAEFAVAIAHGTSAAVALDSTERVAILTGGLAVAVDHADAYAFEYRIFDANRYELGLAQSPYRVRTVFIRPNWGWALAGRRWPVVIEVTLSARDVDFDEVAPALDDLVSRLELARIRDPEGISSRAAAAVRACVASMTPSPRAVSLRFAFDRHGSSLALSAYALDGASFVNVSASSPTSRCLVDATRDADASGMRTARVIVVDVPRTADPDGIAPYSPDVWSRLVVGPTPRVPAQIAAPVAPAAAAPAAPTP